MYRPKIVSRNALSMQVSQRTCFRELFGTVCDLPGLNGACSFHGVLRAWAFPRGHLPSTGADQRDAQHLARAVHQATPGTTLSWWQADPVKQASVRNQPTNSARTWSPALRLPPRAEHPAQSKSGRNLRGPSVYDLSREGGFITNPPVKRVAG